MKYSPAPGGQGFGRGGVARGGGADGAPVSGDGPLYGRKMTGEYENFTDSYQVPSLRDPGMFMPEKDKQKVITF